MSELPTGWDYSALLINKTRDDLVEKYGEPIDDETVARHLGVNADEVKAVLDSRATLGKAVFERLAEEHNKRLIRFIAELVRWNRKKLQE